MQEKTDALIEEIKAILKISGSRTSQHTKSAVKAVEKTFEADRESFIREFAKVENIRQVYLLDFTADLGVSKQMQIPGRSGGTTPTIPLRFRCEVAAIPRRFRNDSAAIPR